MVTGSGIAGGGDDGGRGVEVGGSGTDVPSGVFVAVAGGTSVGASVGVFVGGSAVAVAVGGSSVGVAVAGSVAVVSAAGGTPWASKVLANAGCNTKLTTMKSAPSNANFVLIDLSIEQIPPVRSVNE